MKPRSRFPTRFDSRRGQTLVEYSIVLLVVLMFVFGLIEICRLMLTYNTLAEAARAGVRYAEVHGDDRYGGGSEGPSGGPGCTAPNVVNVVANAASTAGLSASALNVLVCYSPSNAVSNTVTVTANYAYTPIVSFIGLAPTINLSSTTQGTISF